MTKAPGMLGPRQAAHQLGVTTRTLDNWRARGRGPAYVTLEGQIRYRSEDVDAWLDANRVEAAETLPLPFLISRELQRRASSRFVALPLQGLPLFATLSV
jgi:predicted DNA-binding transcriptional regulator AlpA